MNETPSCSRVSHALPLLLSALLAAGWPTLQAAAAEAPKVRAIMKPQEISFFYQAFTSFYSCDGIEGKVKRLMLALGANKESLEVQATSCEGSTVARTPLVTIKLTSPVEATPAALAEMEKQRPQRELAARIRGQRAVGTDAGEQFDAEYKPVSLSRGSLGIEPGDCELVDELRKKVLPKLGVRIVKNNVQCTPNQLNRAQPRLEIEVLIQPASPQAGAPAGSPDASATSVAPESSPRPE